MFYSRHTLIVLGDGRYTADSYIIITVYLHKIPITASLWNKACNVMITMDRPSPNMILLFVTMWSRLELFSETFHIR